MSDRARNYVKNLDNSRLRPAHKSFLFFLADYHSVPHSSAWPSLQTLAEDTGLGLRYVRRLVAACVAAGLITYEPGLGRGKKGLFRFVELDAEVIERKGGRNEERKRGLKEGQKGGLDDTTIRNEPELEPEPRTEDHHADGALKVWLEVKEQLRRELPKAEWDLWVRPTFFIREMDHQFLLLVMPPSNAIITAAQKRKPMLRARLANYGYKFGFAPYPDDSQRDRLANLGWELPPKRKPVEAAV